MCSASQTSPNSSKRASPERDTETNASPKKTKSVDEPEAVAMDIVTVADNRKLWNATTKFSQHWASDTDAIGVRNVMAVFLHAC